MMKLAYVLSASHSGSTLLAMLLGAHPEACTVGELKATSLDDVDTYRCSCGALIKQCGFWAEVHKKMAARGVPFDITDARTDIRSGASPYTRRLLSPLHRGRGLEFIRDAGLLLSPTWRRTLPRIQRTNAALIETVGEITGKRVLVDSSKIGIRLKYLLRNKAFDVRVVRLTRDGRAVALTYVDPTNYANAQDPSVRMARPGRGLSFEAACRQWLRSNEEADHLLAGLDPSRWIRIRYEDYCEDVTGVLADAYQLLGLAPLTSIPDFRAGEHHIVGNAMRRDTTSEVSLDQRWKEVLTAEQLEIFDRVAGALNRKYGYE